MTGSGFVEVPLDEAAQHLGITRDALRKRLRRGKTLRSVERDGETYVLLSADVADADPPRPGVATPGNADVMVYQRLVYSLEEQVELLRQQLETKDRQIEALLSKIPDPGTQTPALAAGTEGAHLPAPRRPWWRFWEPAAEQPLPGPDGNDRHADADGDMARR